MNKQELKQKLAEAKTKIKKNAPQIIAVTSTLVAYGLALALIDQKKKSIAHLRAYTDHLQDDIERAKNATVNLSPEEREKLKNGSSLIFEYPDGDEFCLMHHTEENCTTEY